MFLKLWKIFSVSFFFFLYVQKAWDSRMKVPPGLSCAYILLNTLFSPSSPKFK